MKVISYKELKQLHSNNILNIEEHQNKLKEDNDTILIEYDEKNKMHQCINLFFGYVISFEKCGGWHGTRDILYLGYSSPIKEKRNSSKDFGFLEVERCINYIVNNKDADYKLTIYISNRTLKNQKTIEINGIADVDLNNKYAVKEDVIDKIYRYFGLKLNPNKIIVKYAREIDNSKEV